MQRCIDRLSRGYNPFSIGIESLRLPTNINDKSFSCFFAEGKACPGIAFKEKQKCDEKKHVKKI